MAFLLRTFRLLLPVHDISTVYGDEIPLFLKGKQSKPQLVGLCKAAYSEVQPMHIQGANAAHVVDLVTQAASCMPNWSLTVDARDQGMLQYLAVTKRLKFKVTPARCIVSYLAGGGPA